MKTIFTFVFYFIFLSGHSQNNTNLINGVITHSSSPMANASIILKGTAKGVRTNEKGNYNIASKPGDVLVYSHLGMKTIEVVIEDVTTILNLDMVNEAEALEEVVVKKRRSKNQQDLRKEYEFNKDLIKTSLGIINKRTYAGSLQIFDEKDFHPGATNFIDAIRGKLIGTVGIDSMGYRTFYLRTNNLSPNKKPMGALYDIDGLVTHDSPVNIPLVDIERIAAIKGPAATARYGARGLGGVIIINTKVGLKQKLKGAIVYLNLGQLRAELIDKDFHKAELDGGLPNYLDFLENIPALEVALMNFKDEKYNFKNNPYFFIDVGNYFFQEWKNLEQAEKIWSYIKTNYSNNAVVLKALAFAYEENGMFDQALQVYQKVASIRPSYAQSYRDLANIYSEMGKTSRALNLYGEFMLKSKNKVKADESEGIDFIMNMESLNIVSLKKKSKTNQKDELEKVIGNSAMRIVMEWNNSEAEFDIPFINKENEYFVWQHTYENNTELIQDEKSRGYSSVQFIIDKYASQEWKFNLKYYGNKSFEPTYLKTTIFYNYGRPSQRKEIKVFRLSNENRNVQLFTINPKLNLSLN